MNLLQDCNFTMPSNHSTQIMRWICIWIIAKKWTLINMREITMKEEMKSIWTHRMDFIFINVNDFFIISNYIFLTNHFIKPKHFSRNKRKDTTKWFWYTSIVIIDYTPTCSCDLIVLVCEASCLCDPDCPNS